MKIIPKTKLGTWSVGLIVMMPFLFFIGSRAVYYYPDISSLTKSLFNTGDAYLDLRTRSLL